MAINRRNFIRGAGAAAVAAALPPASLAADGELKPITGGAVAISGAERKARISRAQEIMQRRWFSEPPPSLDRPMG